MSPPGRMLKYAVKPKPSRPKPTGVRMDPKDTLDMENSLSGMYSTGGAVELGDALGAACGSAAARVVRLCLYVYACKGSVIVTCCRSA